MDSAYERGGEENIRIYMWEEETGWRKAHGEETDDYSLPIIKKGNKSIRIRWAGHAVRMQKMRYLYRVVVRRLVAT
jgi:hypothetical protein